MNKKALKSNISLLLAAAIWGLAFVAQSDSMNYIGPFTFGTQRYLLGALAISPVCAVTLTGIKRREGKEVLKKTVARSLGVGSICGCVLFCAATAQQIGIQYTPAGKSGFITALYIVLVPIFGGIFFRNKTSPGMWVSVILAAAGLYFLCVTENFTIEKGDLWVISCAFLFAVQILLIDRYASGTDSALFSFAQFLTVAIISAPIMLIRESIPTAEQMRGALVPVLYTGICSSAVAHTLQVVGQKNAENPTVAALLMSLESVFASVSGMLILHESFSKREFAGVVIMACAVVLSQIQSGKKEKITA